MNIKFTQFFAHTFLLYVRNEYILSIFDNAFVCLSWLQYTFKDLTENMETKSSKWQTSLNQIQKAKQKWRQFSVDKRAVLQQMRLISFAELQIWQKLI